MPLSSWFRLGDVNETLSKVKNWAMSSKAAGFFLSPDDAAGSSYPPPPKLAAGALVKSMDDYRAMYDQSLNDPWGFWSSLVKELHFETPPDPAKFMSYNFDIRKGPVSIKWMEGAITNVCYNVLDRHVKNGMGGKVAFHWEGNYPGDSDMITYAELLLQVCKFSNVLKSKGVVKGDRVAVYLPMIIPLPVVMLACARIGAIHSIVFGGFSAESLAARMLDGRCNILITADAVWRGAKLIHLKDIADDALKICAAKGYALKHCIVVKHLTPSSPSTVQDADENQIPGKRPCHSLKYGWNPGMDSWYHELMDSASTDCDPVWMDAEDPLFMLYTSGSTGTPKGVLHTQAGYLLYTMATFRYDFDHHADDVFWCTADIGWITGHSYVTYGPMGCGATSVMFEGVPLFPDAGRFWDIIDRYSVSKFYTAPTAIRALMKYGDSFVKKYSRQSLKVLGTVGEPINPEAWRWFYEVVGDSRCAVVDTYWQTETGGHVITSLPGCTITKPGSATFPFFGVEPALLTEDGVEIEGPGEGYLVFKRPWPGIMRTVYGSHERFEKTYFTKFPGYYCSGDGCKRDEDGYYWITGRIDDMMNVSGHLLSTAEIESALVAHEAVAEAAVVGAKHDVKGESPYAFVTLKNGYSFSPELVKELNAEVRQKIGPFAVLEAIQEAPGLPKTRSGKIMRRILRVVATSGQEAAQNSALGDTSTLADPSVIEQLIARRCTVKGGQ